MQTILFSQAQMEPAFVSAQHKHLSTWGACGVSTNNLMYLLQSLEQISYLQMVA